MPALSPVPHATAHPPRHPALDSDVLGPSLPLLPLPLIPESTRRARHVFLPSDSRFKQAARFLQALWREAEGLPIGSYRDGAGKVRKLGSFLTAKAGQSGANFLDPEHLPFVNRALIYREIGAVYDLTRLRQNLLSSQPLVFNLFVPLQQDPELATRVCAELFPGLLARVEGVDFEHSPGRGEARFTADGTAFDLVIRGRSLAGARIVLCLEVKYSETAFETCPRFSGRFDQIAPDSGLFVDPAEPRLRANPVQQLFRQHCLAATMRQADLTDQAVLVLVAPAHNHLVQSAAAAYAAHLRDPAQGTIPFISLTLEQIFAALAAAGRPEHARALHRRYTDFSRLTAVLAAEIGGADHPARSARPDRRPPSHRRARSDVARADAAPTRPRARSAAA